MKPFAATNCYYLLAKAIEGKRQYVQETLKAIQDAGFNVIRIWAFNDYDGEDLQGPAWQAGKLQTKPGVPDPTSLAAFDWLVDEVESMGGMQLMMTLTNGLSDYGGMQQYVRWAKGERGPGSKDFQDMERFEFYDNTTVGSNARQYYKNYVAQIVNRYKNRNCLHSWCICNEPRNRVPNARNTAIAEWVHEAAGFVKKLDSKHPVTVGSEGFFGPASPGGFFGQASPATPDWQGKNPYSYNEGCNWILESQSPNLDFVCIHSYGNQWRKEDTPQQWLDFNKRWLADHIEASKTYLGGKPLVLQEYNMPVAQKDDIRPSPLDLRLEYHDYVKQALKSNGPLIGAMCWMMAAEGYNQDGYTLYPSSPEMPTLKEMCREINNPRPS